MPSSATPLARPAESRSLSVSGSSVSVSRVPGPRRPWHTPLQPALQLVPAVTPRSLPAVSFALLLLLAVTSLAAAQPAPPTVTTIERVVAVVDGRPLLLSELKTLEQVRGLAEEAALEALVDERLMYQEAARLPQAEVSPEEAQRATDELVARRPELRDAVPASELQRLVRRESAILKYVEFRFRPQLRVSDEDVRAAFEADPAAGDSFEAAKERLREKLERRALDERVEAWVRELRARADVRYVGRPAPAGAR